MAHTIDSIIAILQQNLKDAAQRQKYYEDITQANSNNPSNLAIANRHAIGALAGALVQALAEQRLSGTDTQNEFTALKVVNS